MPEEVGHLGWMGAEGYQSRMIWGSGGHGRVRQTRNEGSGYLKAEGAVCAKAQFRNQIRIQLWVCGI